MRFGTLNVTSLCMAGSLKRELVECKLDVMSVENAVLSKEEWELSKGAEFSVHRIEFVSDMLPHIVLRSQ